LTTITGAIATRMENERSLDYKDEFDKASSIYTSTDDVNECISSVMIATVMDKHDETQVRSIQKPITIACDVSEGLTKRESCLPHVKRDYIGLRAMREVTILLERWYPRNLSSMSLLFRIEFIAMICFHHGKEVTGMLNAWEQFRTPPAYQRVRLDTMWTDARKITIERGVKESMARQFKDDNGAIWMQDEDTWKQLETKWKASDLFEWFIHHIFFEHNGFRKWQTHQDTFARDFYLKEMYRNPYTGVEGEH
jgi:hypothetical protein